MSWTRVPHRSYSPVYEDGRWTDRFCINVRHECSTEIMRFTYRREADRFIEALDKAGYVFFDTKDPDKTDRPPSRYISLILNDVGILVIDAHRAELLQRYPITPHYKRKVKKYVATLNEQEAA